MAVIKWGINDPNNPRNKKNPELTKKLQEERRNFVGTAIKGAIRTNPDGIIMRPMDEKKDLERENETNDQEGAERTTSQANTDVNIPEDSRDEPEHGNTVSLKDLEGFLSPYIYVSYMPLTFLHNYPFLVPQHIPMETISDFTSPPNALL